MQEVSMAAKYREDYKAVTRALRFAFGVGARVMFRRSVERDAECIHLGASASRRHGPQNVFLDCMILLHLMLFGGLRGGPFGR